MNERELMTLLERGTEDLAPDVDRMLGAGAARGRRSLLRRRVGTAVAAGAVIGALGVGAAALPGSDEARDDLRIATTSSSSPTDGTNVAITARLRSVEAIHADIQRLLGPGTSEPLQGLSAPRVARNGRELSWFYRFDDAEAQVSVTPVGRGCTPPGEQVAHQTGCLRTGDGVEYRTAGPFSIDSYGHPDQGRWQQTVVAWQHGYEIMVISTNIHQDISGTDAVTTLVADQPTISMDQLVALATSDIWFEQ